MAKSNRIRNKTYVKLILKRDLGICQVCGFAGDEVHHIKPLICGGQDVLENMITLCSFCHRNAPETPEKFKEYIKIGGVKIPHLIGIAMLNNSFTNFGEKFKVVKEIISAFQDIDQRHQALKYYCKESLDIPNWVI